MDEKINFKFKFFPSEDLFLKFTDCHSFHIKSCIDDLHHEVGNFFLNDIEYYCTIRTICIDWRPVQDRIVNLTKIIYKRAHMPNTFSK